MTTAAAATTMTTIKTNVMKCYFWSLDLVRFFRGCGVYAIRVPGAVK